MEKYIPALGYRWLTPLYDSVVRLTTREHTFKTALVEKVQIGATENILDLGCGTGTLTILLKQKAPQAEVFGIDGDPEILNLARRKAERNHAEIKFVEGTSFNLPFADGSYDCVTSSLFFHHLTRENKLRTLAELKRILKPRGELYVADWGLPANSLIKLSSRLIQILDGFETTADNFTGLLPELLREEGFAAVEETNYYNTLFGTIRLLSSRTP